MGHRLSKITTKTGDAGTTGLGDGSRVPKTHPRVAAMGDIDELNCVVGLLLTEAMPEALREALTDVQHDLFDLGGEMSIPGYFAIQDAHIERLEALTELLNADLPMLKDFIFARRVASIGVCASGAHRRAACGAFVVEPC